jgi:hypothetical protein
VIRDVLAASARDVSEAVEAAASAFAADAGGFSQMEIVLCGWNEDIESILQVENYSWVLVTDPVGAAADELFGSLSRRDAKAGQRSVGYAGGCRRTVHPCKHFADAVSMPEAQRARTNTVSQPFPFPNKEIKRKLPLYVVGNNRSLMIEPQICLRFGPGDYTRRQQGVHGWRLGCPDNSA